MSLDYSIIIPAYNEELLLADTLKSAQDAQKALSNFTGEIIVVDNNSTDQTSQIAKSFDVKVVFEPINQISRARNCGAKAAAGQYFIFLDADTLLSAQLLKTAIKLLESGKIVGGGTVLDHSIAKQQKIKRLVQLWNFISKFRKLAAGSFMFCLRQAWVDIGGFDQSAYVAEELILSKQLKKWGKKRGMTFRILDIPVVTSFRKFYHFNYFTIVTSLAFGLLVKKNKDKCRIWYERDGKMPS
ncbi:MAG: glycosyltransferase [Sedimentisphaerales bacterium]|nr:glycosyltransferase [Sedimentisphaerales bacterium]